MTVIQLPPAPALDVTQRFGAWLASTTLAERAFFLAFLLLPGAYLAVYCYQMQTPFPLLGTGLGLLLGLMLLFLLFAGVALTYPLLAPAVMAALVYPPSDPDRLTRLDARTFALWFGIPLGLCCLLLWASATSLLAGGWHWLWLLIPAAAWVTSYRVRDRFPGRESRSKQTIDLVLVALSWLLCTAVAFVSYGRSLATAVGGWPGGLQWVALWACMLFYAGLIYVQRDGVEAARRRGPRRMTAALAMILLGLALVGLTHKSVPVSVVSRFLQALQRGGGEPVEVIVAADVAAAEGLLPVAKSASGWVRCRGKLLLDFGDEVSVHFSGAPAVSAMRASEVRRILRLPSPPADAAPRQPTGTQDAACVAIAASTKPT